jgi:hypothetical protein
VYLWFDRWLQRWTRLLGILHEGFWLGYLDPEDLAAITIRSYERSDLYNSCEHNRSGFFSWEQEFIDRFFRPGSRILVAASGGGRELIALHGLGFQVDGFECTPRLVETSQRLLQHLGIPSRVTFCPPDDVPLELTPRDGLIIGWTAYTHIFGKNRRIAFLRKLRALVPPEAPILVSFWVRGEVSPDEVRVFRLAKFFRSLRGQPADPLEPGDHMTDRGYHHYFVETELEAELKAAGFRMCHFSQKDFPHALGIAE